MKIEEFSREEDWIEAGLAALRVAMRGAISGGRSACHVALSGGSTPEPLYRAIASDREVRELAEGVRLEFWIGDERIVPEGSPLRNETMIRRCLAGVALHAWPALPPGKAGETCSIYASELVKEMGTAPVFDLAFLGMGTDGHTAALFPGDRDALDFRGIACPASAPADPRERVTLSFAVWNRARMIRIPVRGAEKAPMVALAGEGAALPICSLRSGDIAMLYLR